jgi:hypothetical protein
MRRPPRVVVLPGRLTPLVWCVGGRALLCLPAGLLDVLDGDALDTLLVHELAHLRRRDHWVRGLEFVALGLYWWHPVAWFARRQLREAEEQCCDAWVVALLPAARRTYAGALVDALDFLCDDPPAVPMPASGVGPVNDLKRRLSMILRGTTPRGLGLGGVLTVLAVASLLPLWPRWAEAQQSTPPPAQGAPEEAKRLEAEMQRLQADLQQRLAEIKKLEARLEEAARARAEQAIKERQEIIKRRIVEEQDRARGRADAARARAEAGRGRAEEKGRRTVITVEVRGLPDNKEVLHEVLQAIKKALPEGVTISVGDGRDMTLRFERSPAGDGRRPEPPAAARRAQPPAPPQPRAGGDVERRLEELQRALEELRREIQNPRDGGRREGPGRNTPPTPRAPDAPRPPAPPAPPAAPERR